MQDSPRSNLPRGDRDEREITVDLRAVLALIRRRKTQYATLAVVSFALSFLICTFLIPQSFTSQISLSFPQSAQPSALSMLAGAAGGAGSKYVGVLRSRRFAEQVAAAAHVREACGLTTHDDAVDAVVKGISVIDNSKDNLVLVNVSLPGPPRFAVGSSARRARVKNAAKIAANAYADVLRSYLETSDTDREAILLRAAKVQLTTAQTEYQDSIRRLAAFVTRAPRQMGATQTTEESTLGSGSGLGAGIGQNSKSVPTTRTSVSTGALAELESLHVERGRLEGEIQSLTAAGSASRSLRQGQLKSLTTLPEEDPLLATARAELNSARNAYALASLQFGPDHPEVIRAGQRLKLAEANLNKQVGAINRRQTTLDVNQQVQLRSLQARLGVVNGLLEKAQKRAYEGLVYSQEFEERRNDVALRLEVLKATASQAALLSLESVSLKNRMAVVDSARTPKSGSPGVAIFTFLSALFTAVILSVYTLIGASRYSSQSGDPAIFVSSPDDLIMEPTSTGLVDSGLNRS